MNFDNLEYLQHGNKRQQDAYAVLTNSQIFSKLKQFDPILVGTIPINIDIENSDLDIICSFANKQKFQKLITDNFSNEEKFSIRELPNLNTFAIVANFFLDGFKIDVFGQPIPTRQQFAYRHMIVEHNLLNKYGEAFRQQIIQLKQKGYKTEPAFGIALDLTGDSYKELLKFENN